MGISLLDTFRSLDADLKASLAEIQSPLLLSFSALDIAENLAGVERLSAEHITACLEAAGIAVSKKSVLQALAKAGSRVSKYRSADGEILYRLMIRGKKEIENILSKEMIRVVRIESGQPRTGRLHLGEELSQLKDIVRICDPYYGVRTLDSLEHIPKACRIRFLTAKTSEDHRKLQAAIKDFVKENPRTEFRLTKNPSQLHDRYVLTDNILLILGHGLKDIGGKESFIIRLDKNVVSDLIREMTCSFDTQWSTGTPL
jgi:hypothetical protein